MTECINCETVLDDYADACNNCGRDDCISDDFSETEMEQVK